MKIEKELVLRDGRVFTDLENGITRRQAWVNRVHYKREEAMARQENPKREVSGIRSAVRYGKKTPEEILKKYKDLPKDLVKWLKRR